jgi:hypothetical protein
MVKVHRGTFIVVMMVLLIGCSAPGPTFTAVSKDYRVELVFAQPPTLNQSVATTLRFYYQETPISVQNVVCDLQMPGMVMGSMRPIADQQSDGSHLVNLLFTMDGEWSIIITADSADGPIRLYVEGITITPDPLITQTPAQE